MPTPPDWRTTLLVAAALETGLLEACAEAGTDADRAARSGLDPRAVGIVCRALAATGHLTDAASGHRLTAAGRALLDASDTGDGIDEAAGILLDARAITAWTRLPAVLRTGVPVDDMSGGDEATRARFMRAMRRVAARRVPDTVRALGAPTGDGRLLDIGGAPGSYAHGFLGAGWTVTVMDLPDTLAVEAPALHAAGIATVAGDARTDPIGGPWDVVYLGNILHLLAPGEARDLVRRAVAALTAGGRLAVQEVLGDLAAQGPGFGVQMLVGTAGGDAYPEPTVRGWMADAGAPVTELVALDDASHHLLMGART